MAGRDLLVIVGVILLVALIFFIGAYFTKTVNAKLKSMPVFAADTHAMRTLDASDAATNKYDNAVFAIFIFLLLSLVVTSWFIESHPVFVFFYFLFIIGSVFGGAFAANVWEKFSADTMMSSELGNFPKTNNILLNLPYYMAVVGVLGAIVMYGKPYVTSG